MRGSYRSDDQQRKSGRSPYRSRYGYEPYPPPPHSHSYYPPPPLPPSQSAAAGYAPPPQNYYSNKDYRTGSPLRSRDRDRDRDWDRERERGDWGWDRERERWEREREWAMMSPPPPLSMSASAAISASTAGPSAVASGSSGSGLSGGKKKPPPDDSSSSGGGLVVYSYKNDYAQRFVDSGFRPQNYIRDGDYSTGFDGYPRLKELIQLKDELVRKRATPPMALQCDLKSFDLSSLGTKFDVILLDPPWKEYHRRAPGVVSTFWTFEEIGNLRIESVAENPSFVFLWVGSAEGLDEGRKLLKKWGFRRCEDICWIKTNPNSERLLDDSDSVFQHTKEHCLMGIKGTVRRNVDGHIIHANVDTDLVIAPEPLLPGSTRKPEELYSIIEHFSLGRRRLELFGEDHNVRRGWVTLGIDISQSTYDPRKYRAYFDQSAAAAAAAAGSGDVWQPQSAPHLLGTTTEIEALRPKSPTRAGSQPAVVSTPNPASSAAGGHPQSGSYM